MLKRSNEMSDAITKDFGAPGDGRLTWSTILDNLQLQVSRGAWSDELGYYKYRPISFFIIDTRKGIPLAAGEFEEWSWSVVDDEDDDNWGRLPDLESFRDTTDTHRQNSYDMGEAVLAGWRAAERRVFETPLHYGNIVLMDRLRIERASAAQSDTVWLLVRRLIAREFRSRRRSRQTSIITLKAFPLEYEGEVTPANEVAFERRRLAMMRLYRRRLGARPFRAHQPGWMWIEVNCPLQPSVQRARPLRGRSRFHSST